MENSLQFWRNVGTRTAPAFVLVDADQFGLAGKNLFNFAPAVADIDGDGDLDIVLGGDFFIGYATVFIENTGTPTAPAFATPYDPLAHGDPFGLGAVFATVRPSFADIDGDGDLDAMLPDGLENIVFLENMAILTKPCPGAPDPRCVGQFSGALQINELAAGKEKLSASLASDRAQPAFGNPLSPGGTNYALCIYNEANQQAAQLGVDRAGEDCGNKSCWRRSDGPGRAALLYRDATAAADGVRMLRLLGGSGAHAAIQLTARNDASRGQQGLPTGIAPALAGTRWVTMQLRTSDAGCSSSLLNNIVKQDGIRFGARTR